MPNSYIPKLQNILDQVLQKNGVDSVSLPATDLEKRRNEILLMREADTELSAVSRFVQIVQSEISTVANVDPNNAIANLGAGLRFVTNQREAIYLLQELLERAYGKVVTVRLSDGKIRRYRLAQANRSVDTRSDGSGIMVVNRLAPVAGLLVSADVGDCVELPGVGEAEVIAVVLLDRSQACNPDDFTEMKFQSKELAEVLTLKQLRQSFTLWLERLKGVSEADEADRDQQLTDAEEAQEISEFVPEEISLGSAFYTRTTRQQEELVRRLRGGLVIVEGIAGSGKTSVALGRLKALHDSQFGYEENGVHEQDDFFARKSEMVGFVRNAQLVEYLKSTIDELSLSGIPVKEFKELQSYLLQQRAQILQLKIPGAKGGKYSRALESIRSKAFEGQMEWLKLVEREMLGIILGQIRQRLDAFRGWAKQLVDVNGLPIKETYLEAADVGAVNFQELVGAALEEAEGEITKFLNSFSSEGKGFALDKFMVRLKRTYDIVYDIVEDKSRWYRLPTGKWSRTRQDVLTGEGYQPFIGRHYGGKFGAHLKKIRDQFREQARRVLLAESGDDGKWLPKLADCYRATLDAPTITAVAPEDARVQIKNRLDAFQLTSVDINLLLAVAQIMSRDHEYRLDDQKRLVAALSTPKFYSTVFVDEVQDFYEIEVFLMASMADPRRAAVTAVGDFKQQLYPGTVKDLKACFPYAQSSELASAILTENKRQLPNLAAFSANFRREIGDLSVPQQIVPENIPELQRLGVARTKLGEKIGEIIESISSAKSIAVISPTPEQAQEVERQAKPFVEALFRETKYSTDNRDLVKRLYVHFTDPRPTKGLEFDVVILTHFDSFNLTKPLEAHGAYVAVSRPREKLVLITVG